MSDWATVYLHAEELEKTAPPNLTKRGLAMLREIWEAQGKPAKPERKAHEHEHGTWYDDGTTDLPHVETRKLDSHYGTDAHRRSAGQIRQRLLQGGYLHAKVEANIDTAQQFIIDMALSAKGFDALIKAGIIKACGK
jgi:hypothetical protein